MFQQVCVVNTGAASREQKKNKKKKQLCCMKLIDVTDN